MVFVRLLSASGAPATTAFTDTKDWQNVADVSVPEGGIGGIRIGVRGSTEIEFPLLNDPFTSRGGARCDVATFRATFGAFVRAYNRDLRRLDRLFSRRRFVWYSAGASAARPNSRRRPARRGAPEPRGAVLAELDSSEVRRVRPLREHRLRPGRGGLSQKIR